MKILFVFEQDISYKQQIPYPKKLIYHNQTQWTISLSSIRECPVNSSMIKWKKQTQKKYLLLRKYNKLMQFSWEEEMATCYKAWEHIMIKIFLLSATIVGHCDFSSTISLPSNSCPQTPEILYSSHPNSLMSQHVSMMAAPSKIFSSMTLS